MTRFEIVNMTVPVTAGLPRRGMRKGTKDANTAMNFAGKEPVVALAELLMK
jgi:hypothetical protein